MSRQTIRHEGDAAEARFLELVRDSRKSAQPKQGDCEVLSGGTWRQVELKQCHRGGTINQVRAIKCIPLVIQCPPRGGGWVVIPPADLVRLVATKSRGQHNEIPFECANLTLNSLPDEYVCGDTALEAAVREALVESSSLAAARKVMSELTDGVRTLNETIKKRVRDLLGPMSG